MIEKKNEYYLVSIIDIYFSLTFHQYKAKEPLKVNKVYDMNLRGRITK